MSRPARILPILAFLVLAVASAHADNPQLAREHFQRGSALYDLGQYRDAAKEYEEAYKQKSDPALLFNIGQAYRFADDPGEAVRAYKAYLRRVPQVANRTEVEGYILRLQKVIEEREHQHEAAAAAAPTTPAVSPTGAAPQPATTAATSAPVASEPQERPPLYKRWWLWAAVGGAVVVVVGVGLAVAYTTPKDAPAPSNALTVTF